MIKREEELRNIEKRASGPRSLKPQATGAAPPPPPPPRRRPPPTAARTTDRRRCADAAAYCCHRYYLPPRNHQKQQQQTRAAGAHVAQPFTKQRRAADPCSRFRAAFESPQRVRPSGSEVRQSHNTPERSSDTAIAARHVSTSGSFDRLCSTNAFLGRTVTSSWVARFLILSCLFASSSPPKITCGRTR